MNIVCKRRKVVNGIVNSEIARPNCPTTIQTCLFEETHSFTRRQIASSANKRFFRAPLRSPDSSQSSEIKTRHRTSPIIFQYGFATSGRAARRTLLKLRDLPEEIAQSYTFLYQSNQTQICAD